MHNILMKDVHIGAELTPIVKHIGLGKMQEFSIMSQASSPIHIDMAYCAKTKFEKPLAPGFMLSAYIGEMMENNFGEQWFLKGEMDIDFMRPVKPGDTLLVKGSIRLQSEKGFVCDVVILNQKEEMVVRGTTSINTSS